jgi:hypothetical protein
VARVVISLCCGVASCHCKKLFPQPPPPSSPKHQHARPPHNQRHPTRALSQSQAYGNCTPEDAVVDTALGPQDRVHLCLDGDGNVASVSEQPDCHESTSAMGHHKDALFRLILDSSKPLVFIPFRDVVQRPCTRATQGRHTGTSNHFFFVRTYRKKRPGFLNMLEGCRHLRALWVCCAQEASLSHCPGRRPTEEAGDTRPHQRQHREQRKQDAVSCQQNSGV